MKLTEVDDAKLVAAYIALRDRRAKRKAEYESADADDKVKQDKIEAELLRRFEARGVDSVSVRGVGTAYKSERTSATVADWDALLDYIRMTGAWEMLERRVNKTAVAQYIDVHNDLPPGVNWFSTVVVNFRRN